MRPEERNCLPAHLRRIQWAGPQHPGKRRLPDPADKVLMGTPMLTDDITTTLQQALPTELQSEAPALARLLIDLANERLAPAEAQSLLSADPSLARVVQALA